MYADVLIEYNSKAIDQTFTYIIPASLKETIKVGMKVLVPFANRTINGFVTNIKDEYDADYSLKEITSIVDEYFCLNKELLEMGSYLQSKTLCTKIAAYQTMLPSSLKVKDQKTNYSKYLVYIELNQDEKTINEFISNNSRSKKQIEILDSIIGITYLTAKIIYASCWDKKFKTKRSLLAYFWLDARLKQSGQKAWTYKMSKRWEPFIRKILFQSAFCWKQHYKEYEDIYLKQKEKWKHHFVCVLSVAKKIVYIMWVLMKEKRKFNPNYQNNI